jgi:hypothetical protein
VPRMLPCISFDRRSSSTNTNNRVIKYTIILINFRESRDNLRHTDSDDGSSGAVNFVGHLWTLLFSHFFLVESPIQEAFNLRQADLLCQISVQYPYCSLTNFKTPRFKNKLTSSGWSGVGQPLNYTYTRAQRNILNCVSNSDRLLLFMLCSVLSTI